ncbi:MAG: hypothetical protein ACYC9L_17430 [Sulfuricaulis sp.]
MERNIKPGIDEQLEKLQKETPDLLEAQEAVRGIDDGAHKRVLSVMNLLPDPLDKTHKYARLTQRVVLEIATKHFVRHCKNIGWWPSGEAPDVIVKRRDDGTWFAVSYLKQSTYHKVKDWNEFPRVGVDEQ